jgi:hypothetical protein
LSGVPPVRALPVPAPLFRRAAFRLPRLSQRDLVLWHSCYPIA